MANVIINDTHLNNIASAIREKNGKTTKYKPAEMATAISAIETGSGSSSSRLPSEYQEVEYIESTGTQYIDTLYTPNINTKLTIDFMDTASNQYENYFGCNDAWRFQRQNSNATNFVWLVNNTQSTFTLDLTTRKKITFTKNGIFDEYNNTILSKVVDTISPAYTMLIFQGYYNNKLDKYGSYRLYSLDIYEGEELKRQFIPCYRKSDNVVGLYDLANNVFYENQGTGEFVKGDPTIPTIEITEDGKYNVSSYDIANVKVLDNLTETLKITSNDVYDVKNYANVDVVVPSTGEWTPEDDWWDIKTILENDTEDYLSKIIYLYISKPNQKITINYSYWSTQLAKMVFSDGTTIIENGTYVLDDLNAKECSKGYKTKYVILYFNTQTPNFGYTNLSGITGLVDDVLYVYIKDVACFNINSSWGFYGFQLQAVESNLPVKLNQNFHFCYVNSPTFEKLPYFEGYNITAFNKGNFFGSSFIIKKEQFIRKYASLIALDDASGGMSNMNCFYGEVIDFLEDFGLDTSIKTAFSSIYGPLHIVSLDFNSCTSWNNGGCQVSSIGEIRNVKASCSWFSNANYVTYDILLKVLDALYDYASEGSTDTYTLTLGTNNLAKLTDEEKAIATNKGWTLN